MSGAGRLGHPQAIEGQQRDQRVLGRGAKPGGDQQRAEFVAIQPGGMGLTVQARAADMHGQGMLEQVFLHCVFVEPGDSAQPLGHRRPGPALGFHITGEALDVHPPRLEQAKMPLPGPGRVLAQVQRICLAGQAGVTGQKPSQRQLLLAGENRLGDGDRGG